MPTILVTGATGAVGSHVVRELQQRGVGVRALVRDPERAMFGPEVELAVGDFADPGSLRAAMDGVDSVFLSCPNAPTQEEWETVAIDVAAEAGVRRIVKLSAFGAERGSPVAFWDAHARIETHLRSGTVPFVLLKPHFFMTNVLGAAGGVRQAGAIFLPVAGAKVAMVDPRDVAATAAVTLTSDGHDGRSYAPSGPEAVTFDDVADALSAVLGRWVSFVAVPDDAAYAQLVGAGVSEEFATPLVATFAALRGGAGAQVTDAVRVLTGWEPRSIGEFLSDHADAFAA